MIDDFRPVKKRPPKSLQHDLHVRSGPPVIIKPDNPAEEPFQTPEQVASTQTLPLPSAEPLVEHLAPELSAPAVGEPKPSWKRKFALHWPPGKKEWISIAVVILLIIGGSSLWMFTHKKTTVVASVPKSAPHKPAVVAPTVVPSDLTGLPVAPSVNAGPVTGVMIENSLDARPQSGLGQAGVVFEAIAEGGITRFLALFQDTAPDNVGPIRSARPYYIQWAMGFNAGYAHVGGSPEALADLRTWPGVRDLDQFANGGYYHRITTRAAPHNVYTPISKLNELEAAKGYTSSKFTPIARKAEAPAKVPTAKTINLTLSGTYYNVHYDYNATNNTYLRSEGGAPHIDANTNTQIAPKVVVALIIPYAYKADGYHSDYVTTGSGPVYIFQDGVVSTGTWTKAKVEGQYVFTDDAHKEIKLNPGQTWFTAVSTTGNVTYAP